MRKSPKAALTFLALSCALASAQTTIRRLTVFPNGNAVQVEIDSSAPITPQSQVIANPDRLVIDFPNAVPGANLHDVTINRGQIRGLRVGLFGKNPPVTRVVVDLNAPQPFEVVPSGSTTVLKLNSAPTAAPEPVVASGSQPGFVAPMSQPQTVASAASIQPAAPPQPRMSVDYKSGKLKIFSDRATLGEVLTEVRRRTGADIAIPPGASQEQVFGTFGPAPSRDVISALLNGSHFNFVIVSADNDPTQLRSVLLTPRDGAPASMPAIVNQQPAAVEVPPPNPEDNAPAPEAEAPPVDETPNPDLAADPAPADTDNDNPQATPDMAPRRHHRRAAGEQPQQADPPQ